MQIRNIRILLIDDNVADIQYIQRLFQDSKIKNQLSVIPNGEIALEHLRESDFSNSGYPDLIMVSYGMQVDNYRVLHTLEDDPKLRDIPRIVLCGSQHEHSEAQHQENTNNLFLVKPVTETTLFETVLKVKTFGLSINPVTKDDPRAALA